MTRALPCLLLALGACAAPDLAQTFQQVDLAVVDSPEAASALFVEAIDQAQESVDICLPQAQDQDLTDALIDAWDRGLQVRVAIDWDQREDAGVLDLADAGLPVFDPADIEEQDMPPSGVSLADVDIRYHEFSLNQEVSWPSSETVMSHAFVVTDNFASDWTIAPRAVAASRVGDLGEGHRVVFTLRGEELAEDLWIEQNQIYGGSDAVAMTAYSSMAKSIADSGWRYPTATDVDLEIWFGPQERLTKRVIDAVYSARSTIRVVTDDFSNDGLARALESKATDGFAVQVIVGPHFGDSSGPLSRTLENADGIELYAVSDADFLPTLVLLDYEPNRLGQRDTARAMVLTHDLYSAGRLYRSDEVMNDQLIDGTMLQLNDYDTPSGQMLQLDALWGELLDAAEEM